jgi:hypothetical protein
VLIGKNKNLVKSFLLRLTNVGEWAVTRYESYRVTVSSRAPSYYVLYLMRCPFRTLARDFNKWTTRVGTAHQ